MLNGKVNQASAPKLAVIGHPLAAEENRMAFHGWRACRVELVLPRTWKARSLGHIYENSALSPAPSRSDAPVLHTLSILGSGRNSLYLWLGLEQRMRAIKPDLIYCWEEPWCLATRQISLLGRRLGIPVVFYTAENRPKKLPWPFASFMRGVFRRSRACVAPTREIAERIRAVGFAGPILTIPLWIRPRRQVRADAVGKVVAYVGRLIPLKRVHLLVESLGLLPGFTLRIIGDGPDRPGLLALAESLGLRSRVDFRGHVDNRDLESHLDGASLLVLPTGENSRQAEQFGKAALEGVSCGLPVLVSRTGNLALLAGTVPTLAAVELDSPEQMSRAIAALLEAYPPDAMLASARRLVQEAYGPEAAARRLEEAFAALLSGEAAP